MMSKLGGSVTLLKVNLIELEGLAMLGKIKRMEVRKCKDINWMKEIIVYTDDGRVLSSGCLEESAVKRNYSVLALYAKKWHKDIVRNDLLDQSPAEKI
jgi:hypothetical protein